MNKKNGLGNRVLTVSCTTALLAGAIAGCSSAGTSAPGQGKDQAQSGSTGPTKITMMNIFSSPEPPKPDSDALKIIEQYTNTKLDITWVRSAAYEDKVNEAIASGELPQLLMVNSNKSTSTVNAIRSGMFWEVGPYLKEYPNLSKMNPQVMNNISVDGKVYGIYRVRPLARGGVMIRKDWLDNLGLKEPTTVEELYNVAKAFTLNDPDKNGKNDTYGISDEGNLTTLSNIALFMGAPNGWGVKDGKITPSFLFPEYYEALKLVKKMFDEKLMTQDFAVSKRMDNMNQGKAGIYFAVIDDAATKHNDLYKLNPNAKIDILPPITGPKGQRVLATTGYNGVFMFPKTSVKTEAELKKILAFFDKSADEKIQNLFAWGIEGRHYTLENGKPVQNDEQNKLLSSEINPLRQMQWEDINKALAGIESPIVSKYKKMYIDNEKLAVSDVTNPFLSATNTEKGSELAKIIDEARTKYIMGAINDAGWNQAIDQWRKNGGDKIMEEFTSEYNKSKK